MLMPPAVWFGGVAVLVQRVLEHQVVEVRLVRGQEDDRVALGERVDVLQLGAVVVSSAAVALRVEQVDQLGDEVDHERAVGGGDLAQVARRLARHARRRASERAREARDAAAERRAREDVLVHEARHLVARAAQRALGALERERGLARDELGEAGRRRESAPPARRQRSRSSETAPARRRRCGSDRGRGAGSAPGAAARDRADRAAGAGRAAAPRGSRRAAWASQATRSGASSGSSPDASAASSARSERRLRGRRDGGSDTTS